MDIFIRKPPCHRTKQIVLDELKKLGLNYSSYELGKIDLGRELSNDQLQDLSSGLMKHGLLISSNEDALVAKIRSLVNELIQKRNTPGNKLHLFLSQRLESDFDSLNNYFRQETGFTIEDLFLENSLEYRRFKRPKTLDYKHFFRKLPN